MARKSIYKKILRRSAVLFFVFIMPIPGAFLSVTLLNEPITINPIGSITLVVTGLLIVNKKSAGHTG